MQDVIALEDLIAVIRRSQGIDGRTLITATTLLEEDLGISGDDGCELLEDIEKEFCISFSDADGSLRAAFDLAEDEYLFHSEGLPALHWIAEKLGLYREKIRALSVGELYRVICQQRKDDCGN